MTEKKSSIRYITRPGGVLVRRIDNTSNQARYGEAVDMDEVHEDAFEIVTKFSQTEPVLPQTLAPEVALAQQETQARKDAEGVVPGNYSELDEEAASRIVAGFKDDPHKQAEFIKAEFGTGNPRQAVLDAATDEAKQIAADDLGVHQEAQQETQQEEVNTGPQPITKPVAKGKSKAKQSKAKTPPPSS